jgi:hypothetical protein
LARQIVNLRRPTMFKLIRNIAIIRAVWGMIRRRR